MNHELFFLNKIIENGSLTKASKELNISQPALSARVSRIEERLGITVFDREKIPVELTEEGQIYINYLKKCDILLQDFEDDLAEARMEKKKQINVGGPSVYVDSLIVECMSAFHEKNPDCDINIVNGYQQELVQMANEGKLDFFICATNGLPKEFEYREICKEKLYLCMPIGWVEKTDSEQPVDFSVLNGKSFIFMGEEQPLQKEIESFLSEYKIDYHNYIRVNQTVTGLRLVESTNSVFIASGGAIQNKGVKDKIAVYPMPENYFGRTIYAAYNKYHELSEPCEEFIQMLKWRGIK